MADFLHYRIPSRFGALGMSAQDTPTGPRVVRIHLPNETPSWFPSETRVLHSPLKELAARIEAYLAGEPVTFDLDLLLMEQCSEFQQRVLLAEFGIPRGWVSTYARVAEHLRAPRAARAVGTALANNPFPIVIPCHRAVRSDGNLGGYRGGLAMKRALLEMEGIAFVGENMVCLDKVWY
ncbi:MAG: methylated-DNA--[protein]-cysteine S-methyltransferase [Anaerolineae bacterium]|nr:methylated-DNA--[protein]-cysteine S-methyltransferase [Anaerolineae bacterium]